MTAIITLTAAGTDVGPFNLYSNLDGYTTAFATGVPKSSLVAGYTSSVVPDFSNYVRIKSAGNCTNYIDVAVGLTKWDFTPVNGIGSEWEACEFLEPTMVLYTSTPTIVVNTTILYHNSNLTGPLFGDGTWFQAVPQRKSYYVNDDGLVLAEFSCLVYQTGFGFGYSDPVEACTETQVMPIGYSPSPELGITKKVFHDAAFTIPFGQDELQQNWYKDISTGYLWKIVNGYVTDSATCGVGVYNHGGSSTTLHYCDSTQTGVWYCSTPNSEGVLYVGNRICTDFALHVGFNGGGDNRWHSCITTMQSFRVDASGNILETAYC